MCVASVPATFAQTKTPSPTSTRTQTTRTTPTPKVTDEATPTATEEAQIDRIQKIKDMVASRVAELNLVEKRGILGTVTEVSNTQITIKDDKGEQRIIDIDELTKFEGNKDNAKDSDDEDSDFGISDIEKDDELSFVGLYNKQTDRLLARVVAVPKSIPVYVRGIILDLDPQEYTITVGSEDKKYVVDFEKSTTAKVFSKEDGTQKSGFSTLEFGQRALIVGFMDSDNDHVIASRILHFTDVPPSAAMKNGSGTPAAVAEEVASPSAKVSPTKKPTSVTNR